MKKKTVPVLLIACIVIVFVVIYFGFPGSTVPASSNTYTAPAPAGPVVEIVSTIAGYTSYGAPDIYGTVKSNTAVPVTAVIAANIYDESGRRQLANGDSEVSVAPYGQSQYEVIIFKSTSIPVNWTYRVYVQDVY
jgi:hypothetical protein